jgi:hypothetical protein
MEPIGKRPGVLQAQRGHPELNLGDSEDEAAYRDGDHVHRKPKKAGRS